MKVFQVLNNLCYWDATKKHPTYASTVNLYSSEILFVEAPDFVFEGWGFDETKDGNERFIQPTPPDGWLYDSTTGTFYEKNPQPVPEPEIDPVTQVQIALAELAESFVQSDTENKLAIAELAETIGGAGNG